MMRDSLSLRQTDLTVYVRIYVGGFESRVQSPESKVQGPESRGQGPESKVGIGCAHLEGMKAKKLEDLLVYQKALEGVVEVSALLARPGSSKDFDLKDQLSQSSSRIPGHIAEGFGQLTDRHFAKYLGIARGSAKETSGHLAVASKKHYISKEEEVRTAGLYDDLAAMLTSLIRYLRRSDYNDRW